MRLARWCRGCQDRVLLAQADLQAGIGGTGEDETQVCRFEDERLRTKDPVRGRIVAP